MATTLEAPHSSRHTTKAGATKYLTFVLNKEEYGIDTMQIREIIRLQPVTQIPESPAYMRGIINLRGKVIPVLDLRKRFGLATQEDTDHTCIIVVQVSEKLFGFVVDTVLEVLDVHTDTVETPQCLGSENRTKYIRGIAKVGNSIKLLLDIDKIMEPAEIKNLATLK